MWCKCVCVSPKGGGCGRDVPPPARSAEALKLMVKTIQVVPCTARKLFARHIHHFGPKLPCGVLDPVLPPTDRRYVDTIYTIAIDDSFDLWCIAATLVGPSLDLHGVNSTFIIVTRR